MLKACSGKFTPIQQFYYHAAAEILPATDNLTEFAPAAAAAATAGAAASRYDHQIAVLGRTVHKKLTESRYFLVGAGAIGCEMLKVWALMGLGTAGNGQVWVTDMDTIEKSNLNRQFLFRPSDVSKLKVCSECSTAQRSTIFLAFHCVLTRPAVSRRAHFSPKRPRAKRRR